MVGKKVNVIKSWFLCIAIFLVFSAALTGCSGSSNVTTPAPTGVTATGGDSQATIAWTAVPGATSYNIYWSTTAGVTKANGTEVTGATSPYTLTGLTNGTTYYFVVTAVSSSSSGTGESAPSSQASCIANPVPTGVTATSGDGQATIAWTPVTGAASYNIYWSATTGVSTANGTKITGATNPYTLTGLTNGTTYYFVVTAINSDGESAPSTEANCIPAVPVPTGVSATAGNGQVTIAWPAVTGAASFNIFWSATSGVTTANGKKIAGVTTPYTVTGLTNGTTYYFVVTEENSKGVESAPSTEVNATPTATPPPAAPTGVAAVAGDLQATVSWTIEPNTTSYNIYWSTTDGVTPANGTQIAGASDPYTLTGLSDGTPYYFVVTAVNSIGESAPSPEANCTPVQPVPQGVIATTGPGAGQVTIAWSPVTSPETGTVSYNIYWSPYSGVTPSNGIKITGATSPFTVNAQTDGGTALTSGTRYYFVVTDVITNSTANTSRESTASAQASAPAQ
jgi:predicted phage tail protein